ncbi:carboxymuconolactone decarboxylase family protein [Mycolicibacterium madagascariense]|uniref:carboxymuconolactone decarboxylase family protein n=1 Tax=Mycolicibacterium madagascariense TaxID=212765 RepID=UPI0013D53CF6|nr:carboxymuconolactone decarboxylase family protein [Mycolicibacterium madagascariense]
MAPIPADQWDDVAIAAIREAFPASAVEAFRSKGRAPNVLATMLHHPALAASFNRFGNVLLAEPAIGHRERELMLLRVAWRTRARYEWVHHVRLARTYGVDALDVAAIAKGDSGSWSPLERDLVAATDQLLDDYRIDDDTWGRLRGQLSDEQLVELPFIVGAYTCLAMAFNSWELQVEVGVNTSGVPPLPDRPAPASE